MNQLDALIQKYFANRTRAFSCWEYIKNHKEFVQGIKGEINEAIVFFNDYYNGHELDEKLLRSSIDLKAALKEPLPSVEQVFVMSLNQHKEEQIIALISQFKFIDNIESVEQIAAIVLLGAYRCAILILYPYLREADLQVASSLEEVLAMMALKGKKTKLFEAVRHWYADYGEEGFSKDLAAAVKNL